MNYLDAQDRMCTGEMRNGQHLCHQCYDGGSGSLLEYQVGLHTDYGALRLFLFSLFLRILHLKGNQSKNTSWPENIKNV